VLVLSKPVGTGVLITQDEPAGVRAAVAEMRRTNRAAAQALAGCAGGPRAVTDVTGYGLAGHAWEMAHRSGVALHLDAGRIPLVPGAREAAASGVRTSADASTRRALEGRVRVTGDVPRELDVLVHDPQTSGGLLAAVRPEDVPALQEQGFSVIGSAHGGPASVEVGLT
jgi:selenide,water dikinase